MYRGLHDLSDESIRKFLATEILDMSATSSTSRTPGVAMQSNFGNISDYNRMSETSNRVLMILKQRSGVAVETISQVKDEDELVLHKSARFKVTGMYRADGHRNVLIIEGEEIGHGPFPEDDVSPAKKPRKPRKPATG